MPCPPPYLRPRPGLVRYLYLAARPEGPHRAAIAGLQKESALPKEMPVDYLGSISRISGPSFDLPPLQQILPMFSLSFRAPM